MGEPRYPPIQPSDLSSEQKEAYDLMSDVAEKTFGSAFIYQTPEKAFVGPFAPLLETPTLISPYFDLLKAISALPGLSPIARETVILATGSHYKAVYETYAHERVALAQTSLSKEQVNLIKVGKKPSDLSEECEVAFDAAIELSNKPGPLRKEVWEKVEKQFGRKGGLALMHYVGLYAYTCVLLNGADVGLPEGEKLLE